MSSISQVVDVEISLSSSTVTRKGFGRALILGTNAVFSERFRIYSSATEVLDDFASSSAEYLAAQAYFAAAVAPDDVMIGRGDVEVIQVEDIDGDLDNVLYTITIDGVAYSVDYTGGAPANKTDLFTAIKMEIEAGDNDDIVCTLVGAAPDQTLKITAADKSIEFSIAVTAELDLTHTAAYIGVDTNLAAIIGQAGGSEWYALINTSRNTGDILKAVSWIESAEGDYIHIACSDAADVPTAATDDIASLMKDANYARSTFFYSEDQANFPEAALFGRMLPLDPGGATYEHKTLAGITADVLTTNEMTNLKAKRALYYVTIGGVDVTQDTKTADGDWIDVQVGIDWLTATLQEDIFALLTTVNKVPFTDAGIQLVGNVITARLKTAVEKDVLASYETKFPKASDFTAEERATRLLDDMEFTGILAGAVHKVKVQGNVSN